MRASQDRVIHPVPQGQGPYHMAIHRVTGQYPGDVLLDRVIQLPHYPIGKPFWARGFRWQFMGEKNGEWLNLKLARIKEATSTVTTYDIQLTVPSVAWPDNLIQPVTDSGIIPWLFATYGIGNIPGAASVHGLSSSQLGNDFVDGWGQVKNGGYLKDFLIWRQGDANSKTIVVPKWSYSPQIFALEISPSGPPIKLWEKVSGSLYPNSYRVWTSVALHPDPAQKKLLCHFQDFEMESGSGFVGIGSLFCGWSTYESALPEFDPIGCPLQDPASWNGWISDHSLGYGDTEADIAEVFDFAVSTWGVTGPNHHYLIGSSHVPRRMLHGYAVIDLLTGQILVEKAISLHSTQSGGYSVKADTFRLEWFRSPFIPATQDPEQVSGWDTWIPQLGQNETLGFNKYWAVRQWDDSPVWLEWDYFISSPSLSQNGSLTYSRWRFGNPNNPQDPFALAPDRYFYYLRTVYGRRDIQFDISATVPWNTCEASLKNGLIAFRGAEWWAGNSWPMD